MPTIVLWIQPISRDKTHMWEVEEHAESKIFRSRLRWSQRLDQDVDGIFIAFRQMFTERSRQMMPTLENTERLQAVQRCTLECFPIKGRMDEANVVCQAVDRVSIEQVGKRHPFLNRMRGRRKAQYTGWITFSRHEESYCQPRENKSSCMQDIRLCLGSTATPKGIVRNSLILMPSTELENSRVRAIEAV